MNKEEFLKVISDIPKSEDKTCVSAYNSINVEDLANAVDRFKKIPSYNDLLKENTNLKQALNEIREYVNSIKDEPDADMYMRLGNYKEFKHILQIIDKVLGDDNNENNIF